MTTLVYHHGDKQIAIDSRASASGTIVSDKYCKVVKRPGRTYFLAGDTCDYDQFVDEHINGKTNDELDCTAFMLEGGKVYHVVRAKDRYKQAELTYSDALGSGWQFAIAAMDHGKSAREAVQYAAKRDAYTGGTIKVYNV